MVINKYVLVPALGVIAFLLTSSAYILLLIPIAIGVMLVSDRLLGGVTPADARRIQALKESCEPMAQRLATSLAKATGQEVEVSGLRVNKGVVEVTLMIGSGLDVYEEMTAVPYDRIKDVKFWQEALTTLATRHSTRPAAA